MPKVSICIPTYNRKGFLKETLASVFAQTYKDYEVVVVDDGSTDGTGEMIKKAAYSNLRYYWQQNAGDAYGHITQEGRKLCERESLGKMARERDDCR